MHFGSFGKMHVILMLWLTFACCKPVTLFIQVRLKRSLEMRGADGVPWTRLCAFPAFWVVAFLIYLNLSISSHDFLIPIWIGLSLRVYRTLKKHST